MFGTYDETLSLVFYILHENLYSVLVNVDSAGQWIILKLQFLVLLLNMEKPVDGSKHGEL